MAKKAPATTYIAINDGREEVIHIGSLDQIAEAITDYCEAEGWDASEAEDFIVVYELGEKMAFGVNTKIEIYF